MKSVFTGIFLLLLAFALAWVAPLIPRWARAMAPSPTPPPVGIEFNGVQLTEYAAGAKIWDLTAEAVRYDPDGRLAQLQGIQARFWERGQVVSTAVSPTAILETGTRDLRMQGGIRVSSPLTQSEILADQVEWQAASQSLHASGSVSFSRGPSHMEARDLWANRSLLRVRMGDPVRARLRIETGWKE